MIQPDILASVQDLARDAAALSDFEGAGALERACSDLLAAAGGFVVDGAALQVLRATVAARAAALAARILIDVVASDLPPAEVEDPMRAAALVMLNGATVAGSKTQRPAGAA